MARTPGARAREYVPLTLEELEGNTLRALPEEAAKLAPPPRGFSAAERSPVQKAFDGYVQDMYNLYLAAGKPDAKVLFTNQFPPYKIKVADPERVDTAHKILNGSARFLGVGLRYGKDTETVDGRWVVSFVAVDKRAVNKTGAAPEE